MSYNSVEKEYVDIFLDKVVESIKESINIDYEYNEKLDTFIIYHDIDFDNNKELKALVGSIIENYLLEKDFYNFCLEYNPIKAIKWTQDTSFIYDELLACINIKNSDISDSYSMVYKSNFITNNVTLESPSSKVNMAGIDNEYDRYQEHSNNGQGVLAA